MINPQFVCRSLSIPVPPNNLIKQLLKDLEDGTLPRVQRQVQALQSRSQDSYNTPYRQVDFFGLTAESRCTAKYHVTQELSQWIDQNFPAGYHEISVAFADGSEIHGPHIDPNRRFVVIMPIIANPEAFNSWWHKKDYKLSFGDGEWPSVTSDYDDLELVHRERLSVDHWYVFDTRIYHSVENCQGPRICLQVDYNEWDMDNNDIATSVK